MRFQSAISTISAATLTLFIATTGAAPTVTAADGSPAQALKAREFLGNIDVQQACDEQIPVKTFANVRGGNGCFDWKCFEVGTAGNSLPDGEFPVDMDKFCKTHFGDAARAECGGGGRFDWQCHN
ncbi:hypothetical protein QBC37DRAFT_405188 [Rhypophila decipiens]|uniref:Secreted protein n=1 Tax=Rhypophila decipiens TaxID=261697 RepID=A0AAN7B354_9PEZI|nr:hypothetical protein QBC37DRAFT_405188 [Rhypophila decipiens]